MSAVNEGQQIVLFQFENNLRAVEVNQLQFGVEESGIYSGGELTIVDPQTINLAQFIGLFTSNFLDVGVNRDVLIKVQTKQNIQFDVSGWGAINTTYGLWASYTWFQNATNYLDFGYGPVGSKPSHAILLGEIAFNGLGEPTAITQDTAKIVENNWVLQQRINQLEIDLSLSGGVLAITDHKNFDSDVSVEEVGKYGYYNGYMYLALTVGTGGAGRWARVAVATAGF